MRNLTTAVSAVALLCALAPAAHAQNAIKDVLPTLPLATTPGSGDHLMVVQGSVTKRLPGNTYIQAGGALGTPSSGSASNLTGLPIGGLTGLGTGIAAFLANPTGLVTSSWLAAGLVIDVARITNLTSNGLVKTTGGNGTLGTATSGTDYAPATSGAAIQKGNSAGGFASAVAKTDYAPATTGAAGTPLANDGVGGFTNFSKSGNTTVLATRGAAVAPSANDCVKWDGSGNLDTAGAACGAGGGGGSLTTTDGTNSVTSTTTMTLDAKTFVVGGSAGSATVVLTNTVGTDHSTADYPLVASDTNVTLPVGSGHIYTMPEAGTVGFGDGWGTCLQNVSTSGNATINTSTSAFLGAGGDQSFNLEGNGWACLNSKGGNWYVQLGHFDTLPASVALSGVLTPSAISATQNNYTPTGLADTSMLRLDGGAADRTITGLAGGVEGRIMTIRNIGTTNKLILSNNSGSSTAANRFQLASEVSLVPNASITLRYDGTASLWTPLSRTPQEFDYTIGWVATTNPDKAVIATASRAMQVTGIRGTVAAAVGTAATASVYKAPSGTSCSSGTIQHTGSFDANGTAATNQTLTLSSTTSDLQLAVGDRLCLSVTNTANWTAGAGNGGVTVSARPL